MSENSATPLSALRARWRAAVASLGAAVQRSLIARGNDAYTDRAIAKRLDLSKTRVAQMFDPDSGVGLQCSDVRAMGDDFAEAFYLAQLADIRSRREAARPAEDPQLVALKVLGRTGRLADDARRACEDGVVTREEWERVDDDLAEIEVEVAHGRAAVRAAVERLGR